MSLHRGDEVQDYNEALDACCAHAHAHADPLLRCPGGDDVQNDGHAIVEGAQMTSSLPDTYYSGAWQ
jgi:hypothetical protein